MSAVEWDGEKARANLRKHGIDFADAVLVLQDDAALTIRDEVAEEERFVTMGTDALGRVLVLVYCWREDRIRVISARAATRREKRSYERRR
jgi:uncharacterized DUF497 family protein